MQHFGTSLNHFEFGYNSLVELFTSIPHLVYLEMDSRDEKKGAKVCLKFAEKSNTINSATPKTPIKNLDLNNNNTTQMVVILLKNSNFFRT